MGFTKLTAMAFIKDEYDLFIFVGFHLESMAIINHGIVEFLDCRHDQFGIRVVELLHQVVGVCCCINASLLEAIKLSDRLVIEIVTVNHEDNLMDIGVLNKDLAGLERRQRLATACCMPDITAGGTILNLIDDFFNSVVLVRS